MPKRIDKHDMELKRLNTTFLLWFAAGIVFLTFVYIFSVTFIPLPEGHEKFADTILGFILGTLVGTVITFFYGSSHSSRDKDKTLEMLSNVQMSVMQKMNEEFDNQRDLLEIDDYDKNMGDTNAIGNVSIGDVSDDDLDAINS